MIRHLRIASLKSSKKPAAIPASIELPNELSPLRIEISSMPSASATICLHNPLFAPPPIAVARVLFTPFSSRYFLQSKSENATPSKTARTKCAFVCVNVTPVKLAFFGFQANAVQSEEAISGIKMFLSFLPAVGTVLSVIFISLYPLTEKKMKEITAELEARRSAAGR